MLSNIVWGSGVDSTTDTDGDGTTDLMEALQKLEVGDSNYPFENCTSAKDVAEVLGTSPNSTKDSDVAKAFAAEVAKFLSDTADATSTEVTDGGNPASTLNYTIEVSSAGYYLIQNTTVPAEESAYTRYILWVSGSETITPKSDIPTVDKKVDDTNDSDSTVDDDPTDPDWKESADYDIGDSVPFLLKGTLPSNFADYTTYEYVFHDVESTGLTFDGSTVKVYVDTDNDGDYDYTVDSTSYTVATNNLNDSCSFEIQFSNLKSITGIPTSGGVSESISLTNASVIYVEYSSTLNEKATIGAGGNTNTVYLEYSNNPNAGGSGDKGKTPEETVIVFTYRLIVNKTDNSSQSLEGAAFDLLKLLSSAPSMTGGTTYYLATGGDYTSTDAYTVTGNAPTSGSYYFMLSDGTNKIIYYYDSGDSKYYQLIDSTTAGTDTTFTFTGLDDGTYKLVETTTPSGYNTIEPIVFKVVATHSSTYSTTGTLTSLVVQDSSGNVISGDTNSGEAFIVESTTKDISTTVVNKSGAEMPATGGMGTKIFYTLGGVLVIGAGVLLIVKRRMRNA